MLKVCTCIKVVVFFFLVKVKYQRIVHIIPNDFFQGDGGQLPPTPRGGRGSTPGLKLNTEKQSYCCYISQCGDVLNTMNEIMSEKQPN